MNNKVDMWIMSTSRYFPAERVALIGDKLSQLPESQFKSMYSLKLKDPMMILLMSIFLGIFGVDRFVLGDVGLGFVKLITLGGLGIWSIVDVFLCQNRAKEKNYFSAMQIINNNTR